MEVLEKKKRLLFFRVSALIEMGLFFACVLILDYFITGGTRFSGVSPHPFWIIVLLISCHYGTGEGLLAALLSSAALLFFNLPEHPPSSDKFDYLLAISKNPLMWISASLVLGEMRHRHIKENEELSGQIAISHERENTIAEAYQGLKTIKESLELHIAGQLNSSISAFRMAPQAQKLDPAEALSGGGALIKAVLRPESFSVFMLEGENLNAAITDGWPEHHSYPLSYSPGQPLFDELIGRQKPLCVINNEDEKALEGHGVIAAPMIYKDTGEMVGMIKIERLGFADLTLTSVQTVSAIADWIAATILHARYYQVLQSESVVNPVHNLMSANYLRRFSDYIVALARRAKMEISLVQVKISNIETLSGPKQMQVAIILAEVVKEVLRNTDLAFEHEPSEGTFIILLPTTTLEGSRLVVDKIASRLEPQCAAKVPEARFSYGIQALNQP